MTPYAGLPQLLAARATYTPDTPAMCAPGRSPLSYGQLWQQVTTVVQALRDLGLRRQDRVAVMVPQGPEMAVAFLACATGATCVPLNPQYRDQELAAYLAALRVQGLILPAGMPSPARTVAQAQGLRLIELSARREAAPGLFTVMPGAPAAQVADGFAQPEDIGLILQTSGTTAQPKNVLLTHRTLCQWAADVGTALALGAQDRCLNIMPLFHAHGLLVTTLASLVAGGSVVYTSEVSVTQFFACLEEFPPTWYSASPTIHSAIVAAAAVHGERIARCPWRFIRSSSAALPPRLGRELEAVFQVPVIEAYGLTDLHIQATCNPLPPGQRRPGSVGVATGAEVAIMDARGELLPVQQRGEVVVRGTHVLATGEAHPEPGGWYRTGDQGYLDPTGYLFLTGRLKELINRGGEKIIPQEVDRVLMDHPAVAQAVTFAVPHVRLGEEVAAAVVLRPDKMVTAHDLRQFALARLASFKVPGTIYIVPELPGSAATGKIQRRYLAQELADTLPAACAGTDSLGAMPTPQEEILAGLYAQVLGVPQADDTADFFALGGDSLLATQLLVRIRDLLHIDVPIAALFEAPTVKALAEKIAAQGQPMQGNPGLSSLPRAAMDTYPVSAAQAQIYALEQHLPGMPWFNRMHVIRLRGPLHIPTLRQSCHDLVRRHEVLRTRFRTIAGQPLQVVAPTVRLPFPVHDLWASPAAVQAHHIEQLIRSELRQPFSLAYGPLMRVRVLRLQAQESLLLVTLHNMVSDRWSIGIVLHELAVLYEACCAGLPAPLPPPLAQYGDFALWQRQWQSSGARDRQLAYWRQQLQSPPAPAFPTDFPRTGTLSLPTASRDFRLSAELSEALQHLSRQEGVTLFMTLLTGFVLLLYGYTRQRDLVVATLMAQRHRREFTGVVGLFTNTALLRLQLPSHATLRDVLQRVRETTLAAYAHQDLPCEELLRVLQQEDGVPRDALCRVLFVVQHAMPQPPASAPLAFQLLEPDRNLAEPGLTPTTFDLIVLLYPGPEGFSGRCVYKTCLFRETTIDRLCQEFRTLLGHIVATPEPLLASVDMLVNR